MNEQLVDVDPAQQEPNETLTLEQAEERLDNHIRENQNPAPPSQIFFARMEFGPGGIGMDIRTGFNPLEQLGAVDLLRQFILDQMKGGGEQTQPEPENEPSIIIH